ncbi:hypothetical protein FACS1894140_4020 [Spirochaetia bacterium]|nr:hypothetical protein FACS1894140_4020 [Spirochaetia bacterium]
MRTLEDIEKDLAAARETLSAVEGTPAEVYSRIVGYYRSVRNWNRGKREEYGERRLYDAAASMTALASRSKAAPAETARVEAHSTSTESTASAIDSNARLLLFVRPACPACPSAKEAAGRLGIPVDLVNADTEAGLAEAARRNVLSTPTAILLSARGEELDRAWDSPSIASFKNRIAS